VGPLADAHDEGARFGSFSEALQCDPRAQLELCELIKLVQDALTCFAAQGRVQQQQAQLLRRYALEEVKYRQLSAELTCSENALRGRVHKATIAFRKHIQECHSELMGLLGHERHS
jgi:DNA-directed RNA polymerase specialized sigma24 family protein